MRIFTLVTATTPATARAARLRQEAPVVYANAAASIPGSGGESAPQDGDAGDGQTKFRARRICKKHPGVSVAHRVWGTLFAV